MRLSFSDADLASLDALTGIDAVAVFVPEDERPLRGAAGYIDWRLCSALSRILKEGHFVGTLGDALLFPSGRRLNSERIFCFGAGPRAGLSPATFAGLARRACEAMTLAGSKGFAAELPAIPSLDDVERARIFMSEGLARFRGDRVVLLGEGRSLAKAFAQVSGKLPGLEIDKDPLGAVTVVSAPTATRVSPGKLARG